MKPRRYQRLSPQQRQEIIRKVVKGGSYRSVAPEFGVAFGRIGQVVRRLGAPIKTEEWNPSPARLSLEERIEIGFGLERGLSYRGIGLSVGRNAGTICREVKGCGGRKGYRPMDAHRQAYQRARRPKTTKLAASSRLCARVIQDLQRLWSPEQISLRLREEFGDDPIMSISHETIYTSIYVQGRGELRKELARCLRTGRAKRKPHGRMGTPGKIPDMVMISDRPAEVEDRAVSGHWEGDLIIGEDGHSQIGTLVERTTRFLMLLHLPADRTAESVRVAITKTIQTLPEALRRTLTWDQGKELAEHLRFTDETGVTVYFCDPHSPWQRGTNENTNGLLRQYFPKGTDLSVHSIETLQSAADSLNGRPRKTLGWRTPSEKLAELVAATA